MFSHLQQLVWHQLARGGNIRTLSSSSRSMASPASALVFPQHGEPEAVLQLQAQPPPTKCQQGQVLVQFLAAPINPSDVNTIQGRYPIKPDLPGVPGHEGVATVVSSGPGVSSLKPGDWVVPLEPGLGTWRSHAVLPAAALHPLPPGLPLAAAAMLCVNPPTALALLQRFVQLRPGDAIIQNGATSVVGQAVIQLARARGVATINVVRPRPNWDETVAKLKALGADVVTTEDRVAGALAGSGLPAPRLALNCIGGSQALAVAKPLAAGKALHCRTRDAHCLLLFPLINTHDAGPRRRARDVWRHGHAAGQRPGGPSHLQGHPFCGLLAVR